MHELFRASIFFFFKLFPPPPSPPKKKKKKIKAQQKISHWNSCVATNWLAYRQRSCVSSSYYGCLAFHVTFLYSHLVWPLRLSPHVKAIFKSRNEACSGWPFSLSCCSEIVPTTSHATASVLEVVCVVCITRKSALNIRAKGGTCIVDCLGCPHER